MLWSRLPARPLAVRQVRPIADPGRRRRGEPLRDLVETRGVFPAHFGELLPVRLTVVGAVAAALRRAIAATYSLCSMIASDCNLRPKTHAMSSTRWLPTVNMSLAAPAVGSSSIELMTSAAESITAPNELIQASLSWLERK